MSVTFRLQNMLETSVRTLLIMECQNGSTRVCSPAQVARTEHGVGVAVQQGLQQAWIFARIVFKIGILDETEIAAGVLDRGSYGCAFSPVHGMPNQADALV